MKPGDTSSSDTDTPRQAPLALWRIAQALLATLYALFGAPEDVARRHTLTGKAHAFLAGWLRCAEALMRRLILIEAAAYPRPNTRPLLRPSRKRVRKLMGFEAERPEAWRVTFRCFSGIGCRGSGIGARGPVRLLDNRDPTTDPRKDRWHQRYWKPVTFRSAWPLAERYEALIRVFNAPAAYARRVAQRLHAVPHRLGEVLRAPPEAVHRVDGFDALAEAVGAAWAPHFSSA